MAGDTGHRWPPSAGARAACLALRTPFVCSPPRLPRSLLLKPPLCSASLSPGPGPGLAAPLRLSWALSARQPRQEPSPRFHLDGGSAGPGAPAPAPRPPTAWPGAAVSGADAARCAQLQERMPLCPPRPVHGGCWALGDAGAAPGSVSQPGGAGRGPSPPAAPRCGQGSVLRGLAAEPSFYMTRGW